MFTTMVWLCAALGITLNLASVHAQTTISLGLKTLLIYRGQADLGLAALYLNGLGTPYIASKGVPTLDRPLYHAIVLTSDMIPEDGLVRVRQYAKKYGVRLVFLRTTSSKTVMPLGIKLLSTKEWTATKDVHVSFNRVTVKKNRNLVDVMNESGSWSVSQARLKPRGFQDTGHWKCVPLLMYTGVSKYSEPKDKVPIAAFIGLLNGAEEMHFGFDAAASELSQGTSPSWTTQAQVTEGEYTMLNLALANVWYTWVTRGIFLGRRQFSLNLQIDDWLLPSTLWNQNGKIKRVTSVDVKKLATWQSKLSKSLKLPKGSDFRLEFAYNGAGHTAFIEADKDAAANGVSLSKATDEHLSHFNWVSHTWTHPNMDWLWKDYCMGKSNTCRVSKPRLDSEITLNQQFAEGRPIIMTSQVLNDVYDGLYMVNTPARPPIPINRFSKHSVVTPEISGLYPRSFQYDNETWPSWATIPVRPNLQLFQVFKSRGIRSVIGDLSRPELNSKTCVPFPYHPEQQSVHHPVISTTKEYGVSGIAIIPRNGPNIAFDTHTSVDYMDWYNSMNRCSASPGPKCSPNSSFHDAIDRQAVNALFFLLQYRQDPHMFHQLNTFSFKPSREDMVSSNPKQTSVEPKEMSLVSYFVERTIVNLLKYINKLPILSPKMEAKEKWYRDRIATDMCGVSASVAVTKGTWKSVSVVGSTNCVAFITNTATSNHLLKMSSSKYGSDTIYRLAVKNTPTKFTLSTRSK